MRLRSLGSISAFLFFSIAVIFSAFSALSTAAIPHPQDSAPPPKPSSVVKPVAYVSLEPVPAGKEFQIAVVAQIMKGFHMNSHKPSDEYLIPTTLTAQPPAAIQLLDVIYPEGRNEKFSFSPDKPLNVYTGTVTLRLRLAAKPDAAPGAAEIPITLRYQACNDTTCLPPVKLPVNAKIEIAAAGAKTRAVHPEIFSAASAKN